MVLYFLTFLCINTIAEDTTLQLIQPRRNYTKQIIMNGVLFLGFGSAAYILHQKGNDAYDRYTASDRISEAVQNWNTVSRYDTYRNICAAGSAIFFVRTVFYYVRNTRVAKTSLAPSLEYDPAKCALLFGFKKRL